ncbi:P-loop containing nucleoside triphosphate hydrolase protein, partial [Amylostereum chailletii]
MSHNEGPPKRLFILDFDILHPECMASEEDLAAALQVFEGSLDVPSLPHIIERALPTELALEFILSAVGDDAFCLFVEFLASEFPTSRNSFNYTSLAVQVLAALSLSLSRLDHVRDLEPANIDEYRRSIELAQRVLLALTSMLNDPAFTSRAEQPTRGQQRSRKKSRAMSRSEVMVDVKAFQNLDIKVPASREEAEELEQSILGRQREILMSLVQMVRRPEVAASIKEKYLSSSGPSSAATSPISPRNNRASSQSPTFEGSATSLPPVEMAPEIKANLQYDSPDDFGSWRIFTSERARRDFKKLGKGDARSFEIVYNKLVELSHGQFSMTNQKRINNFGSVDIFEARLPGDLRLVYQVDCIQEYKDDIPHQVLTLFGLCDHAEVSRVLWDNLSRYQALKGMEYCDACRRRKRSPSDGNEDFVPIYFTEGDPTKAQSGHADIHIVDASFKLSRADEEELHALIALGKYAKISENFWKGVLQDESVAQTHQLSHREQEIVAHTSSCYVLGRSGTGKTTTIIFKIFGLERAWDQSASHEARPRQVFVTKSRLLARKVEYEFIKLLKSDVISQHAPQHFISRAQRAPEELDEYSAMFVEPDAELPEKFSQLTDDHFPLFVTFADLCKLLEGDLLDDKQKQTAWFANQRGSQEAWSVRYKKASQDQYIKYEDFVSNYWPHFPQDLTKNHAPSYVFGQFMGVIKGSEGSLTSANSRLDRQAYERHSGGDMDYRLFEAYQRMKADRGERDVADRTHTLLCALADKGVPGQMIDYLYVDEVQDNLVIDIFLMRMLCRNAGGLFWAGDTAQTISFGSAFRFTELKAIMYRYERSNRALRVSRSVKEPPTFQLLTNFRSPGGVVDCAHSVVELLKLFPNAVDNLDKESGIINGVKPLFVHLDHNLGAEKFFSAFGGSSTLYLGSNQCILVRDDEARDRLEKLYGDIGVVLTLYDSKGLEFDDILVYDFFNDSTVGSTPWRHLAEYANRDSTTSSLQDCRHAPLASELKFLYVAITRTRRNLWIVDGSDVSEHMKNFWFDLGLVELGVQD